MVGAALQTEKLWNWCAIYGSEAFVGTKKDDFIFNGVHWFGSSKISANLGKLKSMVSGAKEYKTNKSIILWVEALWELIIKNLEEGYPGSEAPVGD